MNHHQNSSIDLFPNNYNFCFNLLQTMFVNVKLTIQFIFFLFCYVTVMISQILGYLQDICYKCTDTTLLFIINEHKSIKYFRIIGKQILEELRRKKKCRINDNNYQPNLALCKSCLNLFLNFLIGVNFQLMQICQH